MTLNARGHRWHRWAARTALALVMAMSAWGCDSGGGGQEEPDGAADVQAADGEVTPDGASVDVSTPDATDTGGDVPECSHSGPLGEACQRDCDCLEDLWCSGHGEERVCAAPCTTWAGCEGLELGCPEPVCDFNLGVCRCPCDETSCGDEICYGGHCVGCAMDSDCAGMGCAEGSSGRCVPATGTCTCGGVCGDGECDDYEASVKGCPEDCSGPCTDGQHLATSCNMGETVLLATCEQGSWTAVDPAESCPGETECQRMGGACVEEECYEGAPAGEPLGCTGAQAVCCLPASCTPPGETYYPTVGVCCPGLRALPSTDPMEGAMVQLEGITCMSSCWALHCAPCGDGVCQPYFAESFCTCPEDCPPPPGALVCDGMMGECPTAHCGQDGDDCLQVTWTCEEQECVRHEEMMPGQLCDPVTRQCQ